MSNEFYPLVISHKEQLTPQAIALTFDLPQSISNQFRYQQGQHLTLKIQLNGDDIRRSYSICNGVKKQQLQVAIKAIDSGIFSNYALDQLKPGMSIEVLPPQGHFYSELDKNNQKHYCLIAVGSGITPILSQLESILSVEPNSQVTLIYGNQKISQMMFRDRLCFIKNENMTRFNWLNLLTQESGEAEVLNGRISAEKILQLHNKKLFQIEDFDEVFICGPEAMTLEVAEAFEFWGKSKEQVHYELFFSFSSEQKAQQAQVKRAKKFANKTSIVSLKISGRKTQLPIEMGGKNILDSAIEQGADLPFSCKAGVCATCKAKVISGKVEMDNNHSLTAPELADGMILTCQAHPISDEVEIDFDC